MSGRASCRRCRRCRCRQPQHVPLRVPPHRLATFCERGACWTVDGTPGKGKVRLGFPGCGPAPGAVQGTTFERTWTFPLLVSKPTSQRARGEL